VERSQDRSTSLDLPWKPAQEMASELLEVFASRRIGLYHDAALVYDLRRLRIK
jgi:hypothetical protein